MTVSPPPRESLLRAIRNFPAAPMILARLGRMVMDLESPLDDIAALLKQDASLTARILRIANSVVYGAGEPCASLDEAVVRVGFTEIYRLTGFAATAQIVDRRLGLYGVSAAQFRENALLTALIMEDLADRAGTDRSTAYTVGLLRSIGKIALDRWVNAPGVDQDYESNGSGPLADWETSMVGMGNCEAAEIIMTDWLFPAETVEAIRQHYHPTEASQLAHLLNLAAGAAERCGHGWPGERFYWNPTPEQFALAGVDPDDLDEATRRGLEQFGPVRAAVG
jgi:HD-like signal output (HDOD) protein